MESKFCEICDLAPAKVIVKSLIQEIREIPFYSLNREA